MKKIYEISVLNNVKDVWNNLSWFSWFKLNNYDNEKPRDLGWLGNICIDR
jgi:hypothetical protein